MINQQELNKKLSLKERKVGRQKQIDKLFLQHNKVQEQKLDIQRDRHFKSIRNRAAEINLREGYMEPPAGILPPKPTIIDMDSREREIQRDYRPGPGMIFGEKAEESYKSKVQKHWEYLKELEAQTNKDKHEKKQELEKKKLKERDTIDMELRDFGKDKKANKMKSEYQKRKYKQELEQQLKERGKIGSRNGQRVLSQNQSNYKEYPKSGNLSQVQNPGDLQKNGANIHQNINMGRQITPSISGGVIGNYSDNKEMNATQYHRHRHQNKYDFIKGF